VGQTLVLTAGEYITSQTPAAVEEAVNGVLRKDDGEDEKLSKMIIDIILKNCICRYTVSFILEQGESYIYFFFLAKVRGVGK
jgi:hypothetical protein